MPFYSLVNEREKVTLLAILFVNMWANAEIEADVSDLFSNSPPKLKRDDVFV